MIPAALKLWQQGFTPLVSVIPPGAPLAPSSRITPDQLGKSPGRKLGNGTWVGYGYLKHEVTEADVKQWVQDSANIGLLAEQYPALDIDSPDEWLAKEVMRLALAQLGPAPVRVGRPPKALLPYRLQGEPFARMAVDVVRKGTKSLIEFLGKGRQYLVYGTHPSGRSYEWVGAPLWETTPEQLSPLSFEQADAFLDELVEILNALPDTEARRIGDGKLRSAAVSGDGTPAPSFEALAEAVRCIPNTDEVAPTRDDYIRMGYAIKASWPEDEMAALELFTEWAGKHEVDGRVTCNPETPRFDWRRMVPPYQVGWEWLAGLARNYGFRDAQLDFEKIDATPISDAPPSPRMTDQVEDSDEWLVDMVIEEHGDQMRYVPAMGKWYVWDGARWRQDAVNLADAKIRATTRKMAAQLARTGGAKAERKEAEARAKYLTKADRMTSVRKLLQSDGRLTMRPEAFDADPWALNTPAGVVDLRTGVLAGPDHNVLVSRQTLVAPDASMPCPVWTKFLHEATNGDKELERFLQRLAGYGATGSTVEQKFIWMWGPGGNGKGTFFTAITDVLGDYFARAASDLFSANPNDRHPSGIASLMGARIVLANETQADKRMNEALLKELTGGDAISARLMRADYSTFLPQFLLTFTSNYRPDLRDLGPAMQRRLLMVPFTFKPPKIDLTLGARLRPERPAILAWVIEGALMWQQEGLNPPPAVVQATVEYFEEADAVSRFMQECLVPKQDGSASVVDVFSEWRGWANDHGEFPGTERKLLNALLARGLTVGRGAESRTLRHVELQRRALESV